jgi:phosphate transport system substrate-binding protein
MQNGVTTSLLGVELFGLVVHPSSSIFNLRLDDARLLMDGTTVDWRAVRLDSGPVTLVVPQCFGAVERAMRTLAPGRRLSGSALYADSTEAAVGMVVSDPNAIAFVPIAEMPKDAQVRVLTIDGAAPSLSAFTDGSYPAGTPLWLVTRGGPLACVESLREQLSCGDFTQQAKTLCVRCRGPERDGRGGGTATVRVAAARSQGNGGGALLAKRSEADAAAEEPPRHFDIRAEVAVVRFAVRVQQHVAPAADQLEAEERRPTDEGLGIVVVAVGVAEVDVERSDVEAEGHRAEIDFGVDAGHRRPEVRFELLERIAVRLVDQQVEPVDTDLHAEA